MSDPRIGLVAEGKTDEIVIYEALRSILHPTPFVLKRIQPEDRGNLGGYGEAGSGWGGVFQWCRQYVSQDRPSFSAFDFDLIVIHIDADVAGKKYSDSNIDNAPNQDLPCEKPCPPVMDTVAALRRVVAGWLNHSDEFSLPANWVICIPSKCTEAWIVAALYGPQPQSLECYANWEKWLSIQKIRHGRLRKTSREYQNISSDIYKQWPQVEIKCTTAIRFKSEILSALRRS